YDATTGNRLWAQTGGSSRRVTFAYDSYGLDSAMTLPGGITTLVTHNSRGNVATVTSPKGYVSYFYQLVTGEDTLVATPLGDTTHASSYDASYYTRVRHLYTPMGRDSVTTTYGPSVTLPSPYSTTVPADSLRVEHVYDAEGNL